MIYLQENPLLRKPLEPAHIKSRLLGHWGASPGLSFVYTHLNRLIRKHDLDVVYMAGPGHGAPGMLAPVWLEGSYGEVYPENGWDEEGLRLFFKEFSFPGGIGSHCTPETPGSIHEGGELATDGKVVEMLSEHMLEGYLLTGRHGFFSTYEAFAHVIDSMFNQHAKWLDICNQLSWREKVASLNLLITSTVWRQDHNGFTHQAPGFLDVVVNKSGKVTRIYLPPDVNTLLCVANHCLRNENYINVIVCDKQSHLQYVSMDDAIVHCAKGIGIWQQASNDQGEEPDVVMASAGDIPTLEALAATAMLRQESPDLKICFVNVVNLFKLRPESGYPHGLSDRDFDSLFTVDRPIIFNFRGYPWLIHRLAYRRTNRKNLDVRGYKEKGNINTPLELAINSQIDRFSLAIDVIDRVARLRVAGTTPRRGSATYSCRPATTPMSTGPTCPSTRAGAGRSRETLTKPLSRVTAGGPTPSSRGGQRPTWRSRKLTGSDAASKSGLGKRPGLLRPRGLAMTSSGGAFHEPDPGFRRGDDSIRGCLGEGHDQSTR